MGNETWTPSYWLTVITEKLPQWPAAKDVARLVRNPDGSPKPPQATIRFCANPYEWRS